MKMGLLGFNSEPEFQKLSDMVAGCQNSEAARRQGGFCMPEWNLAKEYAEFTTDYLYASWTLGDKKIFEDYARWLYQLLCPVIASDERGRVRALLMEHFQAVKECVGKTMSGSRQRELEEIVSKGMEAVLAEEAKACTHSEWEKGKYKEERASYLNSLMESDTRKAVALVGNFLQSDIPLPDICVDILGKTMEEVGELWHSHKISVDMEHYCTATTQTAMSQMYPAIFQSRRKGKKMVVACVGGELHEMGARMVADLFEYAGWDSVYLGAASYEELHKAAEEEKPALIALSITMPQYLVECMDSVKRLKEAFTDIRIAVGGHVLESLSEIQKDWRIDVYTRDARELVAWAENMPEEKI